MGARGRPSAASLSVVPLEREAEVRRPDPGAELTPAQAAVWREIAGSLQPGWFSPPNHPLLAAYCRYVVAARRIAQLIEAEEALDTVNLDAYGQLLKMQERESRALATLATKLRLARSSVDDRRKAPKPSSGPRPWEV